MEKRTGKVMAAIAGTAGMLLLTVLLYFPGNSVPNTGGRIRVQATADAHLQLHEAAVSVSRGSDAVFHLFAEEGYSPVNVSAEAYQLELVEKGHYILTLENCQFPSTVSIQECRQVQIRYDANGGEMVDDSKENAYSLAYKVTYRKRPNTDLGYGKIKKKGHTLIGWNTRPDGSGISVGLGSRVTVPEEGELVLYAQWLPWEREELFDYSVSGEKARILYYKGNSDMVVIPSKLGGYTVSSIAGGAFSRKKSKTVVLPVNLYELESRAFTNCDLQELYLFDNIAAISDNSFHNCTQFSTLHINAVRKPRYATAARNSNYADKVDLLLEDDEKKRIVCFSGSSLWFNLDSKQMEEAFNGEYRIVNLGLNGFFCSAAQMDILTGYLKQGDIFLHAPESSSAQQLMADQSMTQNLYMCLELNYDLFALVDIRNLTDVFDSFATYNQVRENMEPGEYDSYPDEWCIDGHGDFSLYLPVKEKDENLADTADFCTEYITQESMERLNSYYSKIHDITGNRVLLTYSAVNENGLPEDCTEEKIREFASRQEKLIREEDAIVFGDVQDALLPGHLFYESNYHLTSRGAKEWTKRLLTSMKEAWEF